MIETKNNLNSGVIVLIVALGFLAAVLTYVGIQISDLYETVYHEHAVASRNAAMEKEFNNKCLNIAEAEQLKGCFRSMLSEDWSTQRDQEILKADKDVARFTRWTAYAAIASFFLAAAGVCFVFLDLRESRASNYRQLRAYVSVSAKAVDMRQGGVCEIQVEIKNTGMTPAYKISTVSTANLIGADANLPAFNQTGGRPYAILGSQCVLEENCSVPINDEELTAIRAGREIVFVSGRIEYSDIANELQHTDYCYIYEGSRDGKMRPSADRYNEAT